MHSGPANHTRHATHTSLYCAYELCPLSKSVSKVRASLRGRTRASHPQTLPFSVVKGSPTPPSLGSQPPPSPHMWGKREEAPVGNDSRSSFAEQLNLKLKQSPWLGFFAFLGSITLIALLIVWLRPVIMPLVMAIFLSYIVRPLAESIAGFDCMSCCRCLGRRRRGQSFSHNVTDETISAEEQGLLKGTRGADEEAVFMARTDDPVTIPRPFGVLLAMIVAVAIIISLLTAAAYSITSFEAHSARYQERAEHLWVDLMKWLSGLTGIDMSEEYDSFPGTASAAVAAAAMPVFMTVVQVVANALLILVFLIFVLLSPPAHKTSLRRRVDDMLTEYIVLKSTLAIGIALSVFLVFCLLDVPMRVFFALATVILYCVPNIGPLIATLLPVPILILEDFPLAKSVAIILVPGAIHVAVGNFVEPLIFSERFTLTPVLVLCSLGVWMLLWGVVGGLLAIPLTCVVRIVFEYLGESWPDLPYVKAVASVFRGKQIDEMCMPASQPIDVLEHDRKSC